MSSKTTLGKVRSKTMLGEVRLKTMLGEVKSKTKRCDAQWDQRRSDVQWDRDHGNAFQTSIMVSGALKFLVGVEIEMIGLIFGCLFCLGFWVWVLGFTVVKLVTADPQFFWFGNGWVLGELGFGNDHGVASAVSCGLVKGQLAELCRE